MGLSRRLRLRLRQCDDHQMSSGRAFGPLLGLALGLTSACSNEAAGPDAATARAVLPEAPGLSALDDCPVPLEKAAWTPGETFVDEYVTGGVARTRITTRVIKVENDTVLTTEERQFIGDDRVQRSDDVNALHLGFISAGFRSAGPEERWRTYEFPSGMHERLRQLRPGEEASFPVTEDTLFGGSPKRTEGLLTLRLLGCGNFVSTPGRSRVVHVFKEKSFHRSYRQGPPAIDEIISDETILAVDSKTGRRVLTGEGDTWVISRS